MQIKILTIDKCTSPSIQSERKTMKYFVLRSNEIAEMNQYSGRPAPKQIKFKSKEIPDRNAIEKLCNKYIGGTNITLQEFKKYDYDDFRFPIEVDLNGI